MNYDEMIQKHMPCPLCGSEDIEPWPHPPGDERLKVICHGCSRVWVSSKSDTKRKKNLCSDCRHAEFDEEDRPYCIISEPVECTENVESCESYDPISSIIKHKKRLTP